jgi:RimJ/RimL family protein N-acetyltransferase
MPTRDDPHAFEVRLRDGATVRLRDATSADREPLRHLFFGLSETTRYLYFCAGVPRNDAWAERFVALGRADGSSSYALVAEVGGEVIGIARFDRAKDPRSAEIGILLADPWQSRGLGALVLRRLTAEARCRAVTTFTGYTAWENRRMLRLARRLFAAHLHTDCALGGCYLTIALDDDNPPDGDCAVCPDPDYPVRAA